jgi:segregation and condensation protein A
MHEILDLLKERKRVQFEELFEGFVTPYDMVVTFLAMLEMGKQKLLRLFQTEPCAPIYIESAVLDVSDPGSGGASFEPGAEGSPSYE